MRDDCATILGPGRGPEALRQRRANELTTNNKLRERPRLNFTRALRGRHAAGGDLIKSFADKASLAGAAQHSQGPNLNPPKRIN
jgi:hypothetical protein